MIHLQIESEGSRRPSQKQGEDSNVTGHYSFT